MKKQKKETVKISNEALADQERKSLKQSKRKRTWRVIDRIFGFLLATMALGVIAALAAGYVLVKGPSPALKDYFCMTFVESRRFDWVPGIYLTQEEVNKLVSDNSQKQAEQVFDPTLITIKAKDAEVEETEDDGPQLNEYGDWDEDGDGIILETVTGNGYVGYMIKVLDPTRVFLGYSMTGATLEDQCRLSNALGGINAGAFQDDGGGGFGNVPDKLTVYDGQLINYGYGYDAIAGLTDDGILVVGYCSPEYVMEQGIRNCVGFGPVLITNGRPEDLSGISSGLNPRTAIGQRKDGCILMLVIDGRQVHSFGATYTDVQSVMLEYGAVNAVNLDGGSSTNMWFNGSYVNSCSSANGIARPIPNAFLFR